MKIIFTIVLLVGSFIISYTQDVKVIEDFRCIGEISIEKKIFDKLSTSFETKYILEKNASRFDEVNFDLGVVYSPYKFLDFGIGYRFTINRQKDGDYEKQQRLSSDIELRQKLKRFNIRYRFRYQNMDDDIQKDNKENPTYNIFRNRLKVSYNINKCRFDPFGYFEHYGRVGTETTYGLKVKVAAGLDYSLKKIGKVKLYYRVDKELNDEHPYMFHNLVVGYKYKF